MIDKDFNDLSQTWSHFGKTCAHWSVLTHNNYLPKNLNTETRQEFFDSGHHSLNDLEKILNRHGMSFHNQTVLDFGCGIGRVTGPCTLVAKKVYGFDVSLPHLQIAKETAPMAEFFHVTSHRVLPQTPVRPDIIYSLMVLQHNRPRLMQRYIILLLESLNSQGCAILHIPDQVHNYQSNQKVNTLEMHFLSRKVVRQLVAQSKCDMLEEIRRPEYNVESYFYVIKKR